MSVEDVTAALRALPEPDLADLLPRLMSRLETYETMLLGERSAMEIREQLLTMLLVVDGHDVALEPDVQTYWDNVDANVRRRLRLRLPKVETDPGAFIDDWLRSLSANQVEAMWLSGGDYALPKGASLLQQLRDLAASDPKLWPSQNG